MIPAIGGGEGGGGGAAGVAEAAEAAEAEVAEAAEAEGAAEVAVEESAGVVAAAPEETVEAQAVRAETRRAEAGRAAASIRMPGRPGAARRIGRRAVGGDRRGVASGSGRGIVDRLPDVLRGSADGRARRRADGGSRHAHPRRQARSGRLDGGAGRHGAENGDDADAGRYRRCARIARSLDERKEGSEGALDQLGEGNGEAAESEQRHRNDGQQDEDGRLTS